MTSPTRRKLLAGAAIGAAAMSIRPALAHDGPTEDAGFTYEIQRTDAEWRTALSDEEFRILRQGGTEPRFSSDYAAGHTDGHFHCRGCDLPLYDGQHKVILPIGWVFFYHAVPNAVLMAIDDSAAEAYGVDAMGTAALFIEAHCRRCGSHLGHLITVQNEIVHCINGTALSHSPGTA